MINITRIGIVLGHDYADVSLFTHDGLMYTARVPPADVVKYAKQTFPEYEITLLDRTQSNPRIDIIQEAQ